MTEAVYGLLRERGAALTRVSASRFPDPEVLTGDFAYLRMHGEKSACSSKYSQAALMRWSQAAAEWAAAGRDMFVYFNDDAHGYAVEDARALRGLVAELCSA